MAQSFDYVIAGGGTAGCVLAARLSAVNADVPLIEAGPPDDHPFIHRMRATSWSCAVMLERRQSSTTRDPSSRTRLLGDGRSSLMNRKSKVRR